MCITWQILASVFVCVYSPLSGLLLHVCVCASSPCTLPSHVCACASSPMCVCAFPLMCVHVPPFPCMCLRASPPMCLCVCVCVCVCLPSHVCACALPCVIVNLCGHVTDYLMKPLRSKHTCARVRVRYPTIIALVHTAPFRLHSVHIPTSLTHHISMPGVGEWENSVAYIVSLSSAFDLCKQYMQKFWAKHTSE